MDVGLAGELVRAGFFLAAFLLGVIAERYLL